MLVREQRRLERLFAPLLASSFGMVSCSNTTTTADATVDSALEGSGNDSSVFDAAEADAFDPCAPQAVMVDAGPVPEGGLECSYFFQYKCGFRTDVVPRSNCYFTINDCQKMCPDPLFNCHAFGDWCDDGGLVADAGPVILECVWCPGGVGRRPAGLRLDDCHGSGALATWLARAAHLEAASVRAFRDLRRDLVRHRAPRILTLGAVRAERDERRHARTMARLARLAGATPARVRAAPYAPRTLDAIAIENAVEGCVRETLGALTASWQATHASDRRIARAMRTIAKEETQHAALAWAIARWAPAPARVRARAVRVAIAEAACEPHPDLVRFAGIPRAEVQLAMIEGLREVWT